MLSILTKKIKKRKKFVIVPGKVVFEKLIQQISCFIITKKPSVLYLASTPQMC